MKVRSDIITRATVGTAVANVPGVTFIDTNAVEGHYEPIREFKPKAFANGYEFYLSGSSKYAAAHQSQGGYEREKAATWDEWGLVIEALYAVDPNAEIGHYTSRSDFIARTADEASRIRLYHDPESYYGRTHKAPWLAAA